MKVYFKPPEFNKSDFKTQIVKDCIVKWNLIFPNAEIIDFNSVSGSLFVKTKEQTEYCHDLQDDLMRLAIGINDYLTQLDVEAKAVIYYIAYSLILKKVSFWIPFFVISVLNFV